SRVPAACGVRWALLPFRWAGGPRIPPFCCARRVARLPFPSAPALPPALHVVAVAAPAAAAAAALVAARASGSAFAPSSLAWAPSPGRGRLAPDRSPLAGWLAGAPC